MSVKTVIVTRGTDDKGERCTPAAIYWLTLKCNSIVKDKIRGYGYQDKKKRLVCELVRKEDVIDMLVKAKGRCLYCSKTVLMRLYVPRSRGQWTLDRIDNTRGHSSDNVVIACLGCNLRRRCRDYNNFLRGEKMIWKKMEN